MSDTIEILEPRELDGDPYEVARRSIEHVVVLIRVAREVLDQSYPVVRNAALERALALGEPELHQAVAAFETGAQAKTLEAVFDNLGQTQDRLRALALAAGYDPDNPLPEG